MSCSLRKVRSNWPLEEEALSHPEKVGSSQLAIPNSTDPSIDPLIAQTAAGVRLHPGRNVCGQCKMGTINAFEAMLPKSWWSLNTATLIGVLCILDTNESQQDQDS